MLFLDQIKCHSMPEENQFSATRLSISLRAAYANETSQADIWTWCSGRALSQAYIWTPVLRKSTESG